MPEATGPTTTVPGQEIRQSPRVVPYYLQLRLPDEEEDAFTLFRPFVARSAQGRTRALTAFMAVKSDPANYGTIESFVMPSSRLPLGPSDVVQAIQSDTEVSTEISLLCRERSRCLSTNLLVIPIEQSLLYVRPLYVASDASNSVPQMQRVIVAFQPGGEGTLTVKIAPTLQLALEAVFGSSPETREEDPGAGPETPTTPSGPDGETGASPRSKRSSIRSTMRTPTTTPRWTNGDLSGAAGHLEDIRDSVRGAPGCGRGRHRVRDGIRVRIGQRKWWHVDDDDHEPRTHDHHGGRRSLTAPANGLAAGARGARVDGPPRGGAVW